MKATALSLVLSVRVLGGGQTPPKSLQPSGVVGRMNGGITRILGGLTLLGAWEGKHIPSAKALFLGRVYTRPMLLSPL
jgi:hypothetical protein